MLKPSRQFYQASTISARQESNYSVRNPWIEKQQETSSNSSSAAPGGGARVHVCLRPPLPPLPPLTLHHQQHLGPLLNHPHTNPVQILPLGQSSSPAPTSTQSSSPVVSGGIGGSCGGRCFAFDTCCYYCLQVVFVIGILTGISLTIAGSVLRNTHRGGSDLMVLTYIGVLLSLVCCLLLSVHCCVRRNAKRRRRLLRAPRARPPSDMHNSIPMQELQLQTAQPRRQVASGDDCSTHTHCYQPLMHRTMIHTRDEHAIFRRS